MTVVLANLQKLLLGVCAIYLLYAVFIWVSILFNFSTTLFYSSGGNSYIHNNEFYTLLNGYPFVTSFGHNSLAGINGNPDPIINIAAWHLSYFWAFFAFIFPLVPYAFSYYATILFCNYFGMLLVTCWIIKNSQTEDKLLKIILSFALYCFSQYIVIIQFPGHHLLYVGPVLIWYYQAMLNKRRWQIFFSFLAVCLTSEECALLISTFGVYFYFFHRDLRKPAIILGLLSFIYFLSVSLILQPAARFYIAGESNYVIYVLKNNLSVRHLFLKIKQALLYDYIGFCILLPLIMIFFVALKNQQSRNHLKYLCLIFIVPSPYWFISFLEFAGTRIYPIIAIVHLALILILVETDLKKLFANRTLKILLLLYLLLYIPVNGRLLRVFLPLPLKSEYSQTEHETLKKQIAQNKRVIAEMDKIPKSSSVSFAVHGGIRAFISDHNFIWEYPNYVDQAEYIVLQKIATKYNQELDKPTANILQTYPNLLPEFLALAEVEKSHNIVTNDEDVLILKRKIKAEIQIRDGLVGLDWVQFIPQIIEGKIAKIRAQF